MSSIMGTALRGAIAGGVATWLMDRVTTRVQQAQSAEDAARERAAWPNGKPTVENLVDLMSEHLGVPLDEPARSRAVQVTHYALGVVPGIGYALLRRRVPLLGAASGLVYGLLLWAVNDEWLNTALGLAGPWDAYPMSSHVRGLVGHATLGVATDIGLIGR